MELVSFDPALCRQCRGLCCLGTPGLWADPERFASLFFPDGFPSPNDLPRQLNRYRLVLRPVLGTNIPAPQRTEEGCTFLTPTGCALPAERRPCQCLALVPSLDTLLTGEIDCRLPARLRSDRVAARWRRWWQLHANFNPTGQIP
ncbi:MAG: hypothetical protein Tsb0017_10450 [Geothermobacteraceae bacterium]